jgi:hypothetical protein
LNPASKAVSDPSLILSVATTPIIRFLPEVCG